MLTIDLLAAYWSKPEVATNGLILLNLLGALLLGLLVGYERSYHGRAAGMRTYGIVCMASAALTIIGGYPGFWFGGHGGAVVMAADPTRIIQGVVTGIGFLGAGTILKGETAQDVHGLTTAAGIWLTAAIGVTCGLGHEATAVFTTGMALIVLKVMPVLERHAARTHRLARGPDDDRGDDAA